VLLPRTKHGVFHRNGSVNHQRCSAFNAMGRPDQETPRALECFITDAAKTPLITCIGVAIS
jgi:hypothetical protein